MNKVVSFINNFLIILLISVFLTSCGTKFSCSPEFAPPPERAFWCAPITAIGDFFSVQPPPAKPSPPTIKCDETIGDRECKAL